MVANDVLKLISSLFPNKYALINSPALAGNMLHIKPTVNGENKSIVLTYFTDLIRYRHRMALKTKLKMNRSTDGIIYK